MSAAHVVLVPLCGRYCWVTEQQRAERVEDQLREYRNHFQGLGDQGSSFTVFEDVWSGSVRVWGEGVGMHKEVNVGVRKCGCEGVHGSAWGCIGV